MLVTFALMCHDQRLFIRDALRAALAQDYQPLEILISDDHSTDGTFDIIQEEIRRYVGPHSIRIVRHNQNIGFENWFRTAQTARGEFVVGAHGDDISRPGRTRCLVEAWHATNASLLSSNADIIDADSRLMSVLNDPKSKPRWLSAAEIAEIGYHPYMNGATLAWHADVFRSFARLDRRRLGAAYDHVLPFRAALLNGGYYTAEPLVQWRIHGKNSGIQSRDNTRGALVQDETHAAYMFGARICMLDDLDYLIRQGRNIKDGKHLRESLVEGILNLVRTFTFRRNELIANGSRPTWIGKAEMEGRVDYSKGYYDNRQFGLGALVNRIRRLPIKIIKRLLA